MLHGIRVLLFASILTLATSAVDAEEIALSNYVSPLWEGYALSVDLPSGAGWTDEFSAHAFGSGVTASHKADNASGPVRIGLSIGSYGEEVSFDSLLTRERENWKNFAMIVHQDGENQALNRDTFFFATSDETCFDGAVEVACKANRLNYVGIAHGHLRVWLYLHAPDNAVLESTRPLFDRIAATVDVLTEDALPDGAEHLYSSVAATISKRRDHYLEAHVQATLPANWVAEELAVLHATETEEQGLLSIAIFYDVAGPDPFPGEPYEAFFLIIQGMPYRSLGPSDYFATADEHLFSFLSSFNETDTPETVVQPSAQADADGFCLSKVETQYSSGTGDVRVRTFEGKGLDGRDAKMRIYTAGGITQACHIVHIADPDLFERTDGPGNTVIEGLRVETFDPTLLGLR